MFLNDIMDDLTSGFLQPSQPAVKEPDNYVMQSSMNPAPVTPTTVPSNYVMQSSVNPSPVVEATPIQAASSSSSDWSWLTNIANAFSSSFVPKQKAVKPVTIPYIPYQQPGFDWKILVIGGMGLAAVYLLMNKPKSRRR